MRRLLLLPFILAGVVAACSAAKLLDANQDCFQSTDCKPGLACVPAAATPTNPNRHVCSTDLSGVVPEAGADGGAPRDSAPPDGAPPDGQPPADTGTPDTGTPDTGPPADSGSD